jgi:LysM repeat protein
MGATDSSTSTVSDLGQTLGIPAFNPSTNTSGSTSTKSGTYVSTQTSSQIPNDLALTQTINNIFKQYYGRDANQNELSIWLPQLKAQYTSPTGKTKTTVRSTYKDGNLVSTEYLTADGVNPKDWLDTKIKTDLQIGKQEVNKLAVPEGPSGKYFVDFKNFAAKNGIMLSNQAATDYANKAVAGTLDENTIYNTIRESAASAFPQLADKIKAGIDLKTLADPYIQSMSNILEVPYTSIDLFDPKIRGALSYTLPDGKVGTKSIYDFEKELRQDPRWQYTNNARQDVSNAAIKVLKDFGFQG